MKNTMLKLLTLAWLAFLVVPQSAQACATCYGASDSDLARGMNWGILSLLLVVLMVLGGIGSFFVYVARRTAALETSEPQVDSAPSVDAAPEQVETHK
jgi:hypothetical protein